MPDLISSLQLNDRVTKAVELAAGRLNIAHDPKKIVLRWDLIGRILRDFQQADRFANEVGAQLGEMGLKVQPAVLKIDKRIIAGYFERINVPAINEIGR